MLEHLRDCDVVILEANHDPALVAVSCRHYLNKQWVLGDRGHLSNQAHASAIVELQQRSFHHKTPSHIFLAHISRDHNTIPHALEQIGTILRQHAVPSLLVPTYHRQKSEIITIE
jgi:phosphoribosyl 1,2-cyclic phosphodiesterase